MSPSTLTLDPRAPFHYSLSNEAVKMEVLANILGTLSGLRFVTDDLAPTQVVTTAIAMQITYAIMARVFAAQRSRAPFPWLLAGFVTGIAAIVALLVLGDREPDHDS